MNINYKQFLAFSLVGVSALGAIATANAASLSTTTDLATTKTTHEQVRSAIKQALSSGDYQAFLTATKDKPTDVPTITEAQFNILVQAEKLRTAGDEAGAKKLLDDAGIKTLPFGEGRDHHRGHGEMNMPNLTDAQKETLKQAKTLFEAGKKDEAETLLKNAGIKMPMHREGGEHGRMGKPPFANLTDAQKTTLQQARTLFEAGKKDEADALLKNAGITLPTHTHMQPTEATTSTQ